MLSEMSRKHSGKRRKYWLPAFSSFPTIFSKGFFFRVLKSWDCLVKGYCWKSGFAIGHSHIINPFPHIKILDQTKLKAFADDKLNVTKMIFSAFDRVENIVEKGEIACTSNFSFSRNVFKRLLS